MHKRVANGERGGRCCKTQSHISASERGRTTTKVIARPHLSVSLFLARFARRAVDRDAKKHNTTSFCGEGQGQRNLAQICVLFHYQVAIQKAKQNLRKELQLSLSTRRFPFAAPAPSHTPPPPPTCMSTCPVGETHPTSSDDKV